MPQSLTMIMAVVKPYLAEKVLAVLAEMPTEEVTVHSVKGFGRQKNYLDQYRDTEYAMAFLPKVEFQIWVRSCHAENVIRGLVQVARSGRMGDGKIFRLPALFSGDEANVVPPLGSNLPDDP